jgi:hypothetical protein
MDEVIYAVAPRSPPAIPSKEKRPPPDRGS